MGLQVLVTRAAWSRLALTQDKILQSSNAGRFNTTEIHCTEYHPAIRKGELPSLCLTLIALHTHQPILLHRLASMFLAVFSQGRRSQWTFSWRVVDQYNQTVRCGAAAVRLQASLLQNSITTAS